MNLTTIIHLPATNTENFTDIGVILLNLANVTEPNYGEGLTKK